jgi:L-alanine-DL-glutamate epimerase-like enolase superfamily enzyme
LDSFLFSVTNPVVGGMEVRQGVVHLSPTPGLGIDIDPEFLRKLRATA